MMTSLISLNLRVKLNLFRPKDQMQFHNTFTDQHILEELDEDLLNK